MCLVDIFKIFLLANYFRFDPGENSVPYRLCFMAFVGMWATRLSAPDRCERRLPSLRSETLENALTNTEYKKTPVGISTNESLLKF